MTGHAGTVTEHLVSLFRNRAAAPEIPSPQQDGPEVLSIASPTWNALLCAVTTVLKTPRHLHGQSKRLNLHGVEVRLPHELSSNAHTEESEEEIDIMGDSLGETPQLLNPPGHEEQKLAAGGASSLAGPTEASRDELAAEATEQARVDYREPQQAREKGGNEAGRPPPARVSRRLEARRWAPHTYLRP